MARELFTRESAGPGLLITLTEAVDTTNFGSVVDRICEIVTRESIGHLALDMRNVDYLYSTALGKLVKLHKRVKEKRGTLYLCEVDSSCRKVLEVTQLDRLLSICDTADDVRAAWASIVPSHSKPPALAEIDERIGDFNQREVFDRLIVDADSAVRDERPWGRIDWMARPDLVASRHVLFGRTRLDPDGAQPFHQHPEHEEVLYVVSGRAELWVERNRRTLEAGQLAVIPTGRVHAVVNVAAEELELLEVFAPGELTSNFEVDVSDREPWRSMSHGRRARNFELDRVGDVLFVRVTTEAIVDPYAIEQFRSGLLAIVDRESCERLILELNRVKHVATGALGALAKLRERITERGGTLEVCGPGEEVAKVLEITQLKRIIPVHVDRDEALRSG